MRFTGGCGNLPEAQADAMYELFVDAFNGFQGAMMFGGTRMIRTSDHKSVRHGITEVPPMIRRHNPECKMLGVVPIEKPPLELDFDLGHVISREREYTTVVHPGQDYCLIIQASPDDGVIWEAEYRFCLTFSAMLRDHAGFESLLVSYNGGNTTEKEILNTANLGWPVLLIDGSGGKTEHYARDEEFLTRCQNVRVCQNNVASLRQSLAVMGALEFLPDSNVISFDKRRRETA